jgi:hypothetical protein
MNAAMAIVLAGATLALAVPARAQSSEDLVQARELFAAADEATSAGRIAEAVDLYQRSLAIVRRAGTAYNLAVVLLAGGRAVEAEVVVTSLLAGEYGAPSDAVLARATELRERARGAVAVLSVRVDGPPGTTLRLDGAPIEGVAPGTDIERRVDPGAHRLLARAPGGEIVELELELRAGERRELSMTVDAVLTQPGAAAVPGAPRDTSVWDEPWLHVLLGAALLAGAAALTVGLVADATSLPSDPVWGHAETLVAW